MQKKKLKNLFIDLMEDPGIIKVVFLGTGTSTGVPVVACNCRVCMSRDTRDHRLRTSVKVETNGHNLVIDCGPDFRYQMIRAKVEDISAIILTHGHRDHTAGLNDVRAFNYVLNKTIDIYAGKDVINSIKTEFPYIFTEKRYFGAPQLNFHIIDNRPFHIQDIEVLPIEVLHYKLTIFGFRFGDFTYITDASHINEQEREKIRNTDVLVINALRKSKHISHFSLGEAIEVIEEINPRVAYITHLSHFIGLHDEVQKSLPENVFLAYDGLKLEVKERHPKVY